MIASIDWLRQEAAKEKRSCTAGRRYLIDCIQSCLTGGGFGQLFGRRAATFLHGETGTATDDDSPEDAAFDQAKFFKASGDFDHDAMCPIVAASDLGRFVQSLLVSGKELCVSMSWGRVAGSAISMPPPPPPR